MKNSIITLSILIFFTACHKQKWEDHSFNCALNKPVNANHSKGPEIQSIIDKLAKQGIPGVSVAILTEEGYWTGTSGFAKIENKTPMQACHLQYGQSVAKTYMAVAILRLKEMGKIQLDNKITQYLPENIYSKITEADKITVRMLLNHTSGIAEYNSDPRYVTYLLQHPLHKFTPIDYLEYVDGKPSQFTPGSKYVYTNTNYLLLALIGDFITGDHAHFIRAELFNKIGLTQSFYRDHESYLNKYESVNSYWDRYSNGSIENCTEIQKINVASMIGDDGIIATPYDYITFLNALFNKRIIADSTLNEMLTFVYKENNSNSGYGLGIHKDIYKGFVEYGHTGGGIGAGCFLSYFPEKNAYLFVAINIGTSVNSPVFEKAQYLIDELYDVIIR